MYVIPSHSLQCWNLQIRTDSLCKHDPDPSAILDVWGSEFHKDMIANVKIEDCPRCTFGAYNDEFSNLVGQAPKSKQLFVLALFKDSTQFTSLKTILGTSAA